jgi:phage tail-like protein
VSVPSLLPPASTPVERAIEQVMARIGAVPVPLADVGNPLRTPEAVLPFLAWGLSADLWDQAWPLEKRRNVAARSVELHRLKGTAAGLRAHVRIAGGEVTQIVAPPQGMFLSGTLSKAAMDAWLRTMPQIRVYFARERGSGAGLSFIGRAFLGHGFLRFDAGRGLYGRAARLWDGGSEVRLRQVDLTSARQERAGVRVERVSLPGDGRGAAFLGRSALGAAFFGAGVRQARVATWRQDVRYEHTVSALSLRSVATGLAPVDVRSERISDRGNAGPVLFAGRIIGRTFLGRDDAKWMMYDRIVLHDPARAAPRVAAWSFLGAARLGLAPFTAKSVIDLRQGSPGRALFFGSGFVGFGLFRAEDGRRQRDVARSVIVSKAVRDRHLVTHKLTRSRRFGDRIPMDGSISFKSRLPFRL